MLTKIAYSTEATATGGGRDGKSATTDGALAVTLAVPKEMGGNGGGNNPEQLFAVGYAACYLGAMRFAASSEKLGTVPADASVTSTVSIGPRDEGGFGLQVELKVSMPGVDRETAQKIVDRGHFICPYSNATKGNIDVTTTLV
ncbi:MAG: organic hydroperoxide resistance protein [Cypionkella sp.]|uniref:organic hydroperoxide resistance protein n=1 Tax=Cypionkella sp. TaxID=2811411 RepID=UPI0026147B99|nr:organic hydroperoxide resistance protein [Cypionkella sp.]MDB5659282.1 organic hydroperoxide resistance protein [Cypionkella sp.]MDB5663595.1 organic hydroperoxide resistance protein [Cypionkella sp.]